VIKETTERALKANEYFNLELGTYPESKAMINQILKKG